MDLTFDNFIDALPADPETGNFTRAVRNACYSFVQPTPVTQPKVPVRRISRQRWGFLPTMCSAKPSRTSWVGMHYCLGCVPMRSIRRPSIWRMGRMTRWRAISLGELVTQAGARWELQRKGPTEWLDTPMVAVLRSSVREFLCSEAMHHLGIPTTRALSPPTGETVLRDMFYNGNAKYEPGAIVRRVAPSFIDSNFEILAAQGSRATQTTRAVHH